MGGSFTGRGCGGKQRACARCGPRHHPPHRAPERRRCRRCRIWHGGAHRVLLVDGLGQRQQRFARQRAHQRVAGAFFDPIEHAQIALAFVAEGRVGALVGLAQVDGDAQALGVLVHELSALARAVGQQAAADEFEALRAQVEQLHRHLDAPRQPARKVFFLGLYFDWVTGLDRVHAVRQRGALHPALRGARRQPRLQLCHLLLLLLPHGAAAGRRAQHQQPRSRRRHGPARPGLAAHRHGLQRRRHGLLRHGQEQIVQSLAVGFPARRTRGVVGVGQQPGLHARGVRGFEFAVDPGADLFVADAFGFHVHTTRRSVGAAAALSPSRNRRNVARARHTRDITVPTGMCITSATSA
jgi:hypothetical protein